MLQSIIKVVKRKAMLAFCCERFRGDDQIKNIDNAVLECMNLGIKTEAERFVHHLEFAETECGSINNLRTYRALPPLMV